MAAARLAPQRTGYSHAGKQSATVSCQQGLPVIRGHGGSAHRSDTRADVDAPSDMLRECPRGNGLDRGCHPVVVNATGTPAMTKKSKIPNPSEIQGKYPREPKPPMASLGIPRGIDYRCVSSLVLASVRHSLHWGGPVCIPLGASPWAGPVVVRPVTVNTLAEFTAAGHE
jgi:hypothetical protein